MSLTHRPHGVLATPNIGAGRLLDMWNSGNLYFVDGDLSGASSSSDGLSPDTAVSKPSEAVTKSTKNAIIYVKPRNTTASAQTYYADNITIPLTKPGIKIVGAGADESSPYGGVDIKASTTSSPVVTVNSNGVILEGMRLAGTGQDATVSIVYAAANGTTANTFGLTTRGCHFGNGRGHGAAAAAVYLNSSWNSKVIDCHFWNCLTGIAVLTTSGGQTLGPHIIGCTFNGIGTNRDCDIYVSQGGSTGSYGLLIDHCRFNDALPAHGDGTIARFIKIVNAGTGAVTNNTFAFTAAAATGLAGAAGTQCIIPASIFMANNWYDATAAGKGMLDRI